MITVLAAVLSGILFYLSQGFDHVWALAWLAPLPLLWLAYGKTPTWQVMGASVIAILASAGDFLRSPYLHLIPPFVLLSALTVDTALFCIAVWFARFVQRRGSPWLTLLAFPACWTAFEFLMELRSPNGTYGSFAYSTMAAPVLIQSASLFGMYAVTFLICLFSNTLAMALRFKRDVGVAVGLGLAIFAANLVFGVVRLTRPQPDMLRVAAIVDETALDASWHAHSVAADREVTETFAREIRLAALQGVRFAVTPEGGMASTPDGQSAIIAPLVAASKDTGVQIIAGFHSDTPAADFALAITPDGKVQRYDKRHPVPGLEDRFVKRTDLPWFDPRTTAWLLPAMRKDVWWPSGRMRQRASPWPSPICRPGRAQRSTRGSGMSFPGSASSSLSRLAPGWRSGGGCAAPRRTERSRDSVSLRDSHCRRLEHGHGLQCTCRDGCSFDSVASSDPVMGVPGVRRLTWARPAALAIPLASSL